MKRVALLIDEAFEDSEFAYPYGRLKAAGYDVDIIAKEKRTYRGKKGAEAHADLTLADALPGGHAPERLCRIPEMITFVRTIAAAGQTICAVCHGPLLLAEAGLLRGRTVTGYKSTETALTESGGNYTGESIERDGTIITARDPRSLPEMVRLFIGMLEGQGPL